MSASLPLVEAPPLPAILDQSPDELRTWLAERGEPPMRAKQIRRWIFQARATNFEQMSDLPKGLRIELASSFSVFGSRIDIWSGRTTWL